MVKFNGQEWDITITRNLPLFHIYSEMTGQVLYAKNYGIITRHTVAICQNGRRVFYFAEKENLKEYNKSVEKICLSPSKFKKMEKTIYKFGDNLSEASGNLERKVSLAPFKTFVECYQQLIPALYLGSAIGRHMLGLLFLNLKKLYPSASQTELDILAGEITYPKKNTPLTESQTELLKIGAALQKKGLSANDIGRDKDIYKKFKNYFKKYRVIPVNFCEESWTEKEIIGHLSNLMQGGCAKELKNILEQHKKRIKLCEEKLSKIKDKKIKQIALSLQIGTLLNEYRKFIFCRASLAYRPLFELIAKLNGLSNWKELWKLSSDEIINLYFKKDRRVLKVLNERKIFGLLHSKTKNSYTYRAMTKKELDLFVKEIKRIVPSEYKNTEVKEVRGMIANPGVVKGIAKIILGSSDFHKFKNNDIIVASMTSVDFVPIMERASAFITNEGGVTSHASIVSRELNKPCIIGTKNATSIIRDGDLVEVNANKGVVKILKR
jgi:phosphohistidine swiveling domain-containing protein